MDFDLSNKIYIQIDKYWFDFTNFTNHPGGTKILRDFHLKDGTSMFNGIKEHHDSYIEGKLDDLLIKNNLLIVYLNLLINCKN